MKLRNDFVTNSSSSSFIIGKIGDETTIDVVFHIIRDFYKEYNEAKNKLIKDIDKYEILYDEKEQRFKFKTGKTWDNKNSKINDEIKKIYGIDTWDYFEDYSWTKFETYKEYEEYWQDKMFNNANDSHIHAPFSIIDYTNGKTYIPIHNGYIKNVETEMYDTVKANETEEFGWYIGCGDELLEGKNQTKTFCKYCPMKNNKQKCKEVNDRFASGELNNDNAVIELLGKICIRSECGYIPDFVVERLSKITPYHCNHMG